MQTTAEGRKETQKAEAFEPRADVARDPASGEPMEFPSATPALAAKAKDLEALRDAVVDAANVGAGLWLTYLFVLFYLLVAVGSVTHRDLFFESPIRLPFLSVDLPLVGFFVLGPALFLIVHTYVLLHFVMLADKVGVFHGELQAQIVEEDVRARLRRQLPSNIFVQFLAGPHEVRKGIMGFILRLIAQVSLVAGPIALLVFFQLQFLPYHQAAVTWWQRIAIVADLALLWMLWPSVARGETIELAWRGMRRGKVVAMVRASFVPILLVFMIATFPGEWLDEKLFAPEPASRRGLLWPLTSLHEMLVAGDVDLASRKPTSLWSNRLVLPSLDVIDHTKFDSEAKIASLTETVSLRLRHLEGAVLIGATLRKVDFTAAKLQGASLDSTDLRGAKFGCELTRKYCAQFQDASLNYAQLQGANLFGAQLEGVSLNGAQLQGANLIFVHLQGVSLNGAQLQGANLRGARLQGASLHYAQLQGADLSYAYLQGVSLDGAQLQGAELFLAQLEGARLDRAQLQGADLRLAQLQGASLDDAELQGVLLRKAQLDGASLQRVFVWRADVPLQNSITGARVVSPNTVSVDSFETLKRLIQEHVPEGRLRDLALTRIEPRLDPTKGWEGERKMAEAWAALGSSSPARDVYEKGLAKQLRKTGCAADGAPYLLLGLLNRLEDLKVPQESALAAQFLDEEHCAGARGLSVAAKAALEAIRDLGPRVASP